jgi:hypothetical protein
MNEENDMTMTGRCLCGDVAYAIDNAPAMTGVCHCKNCQRQAGSAFSTLAGVPTAEFHLTSGDLTLYEDRDTESGNAVGRYFCGRCGSPIYSALSTQPETLFLKTGTLDDTSAFQPQFHAWCDSKQDWVALEPGVPTLAKQG